MAQEDYHDYIAAASKKYGVSENLIRQVIQNESSWNPKAASGTGPVGLMQISKAVAKDYGYSQADRLDPQKNIEMGTRYLASNLKAFNGNTAHALLGYNQGTGGAKQMLAGKIPMAEEGVNYVNKFKPGYLKKDSPIPSAQQYMAPATSDLIQMGKAGMNPQADDKFKTSALGNVTPVEPKQEEKKELTGAQKVSLIQNVLENLKVPQQQQVRAPAAPVQIRDGQVNMKMFQGPEDEGIQWKAPALVNVLGR